MGADNKRRNLKKKQVTNGMKLPHFFEHLDLSSVFLMKVNRRGTVVDGIQRRSVRF
jgi:hypothetical protein